MLRMKCWLSLGLITTILVHVVHAETEFDPDARARLIVPYLDDQTAFVGHIDATRMNVGDARRWAREAFPINEDVFPDREKDEKKIRVWWKAFAMAGGKNLYAIFSMVSVGPAPEHPDTSPLLFVVPLADKSREGSLVDFFQGVMPTLHISRGDGVLLVGDAHRISRVKKAVPDERPEIAAAFQAAGDTVAQILVVPASKARRSLDAELPNLWQAIGAGRDAGFIDGLDWVAVGLDCAPSPAALHLVAQWNTQESAKASPEKWNALVGLVAKQPAIVAFVPGLGRFVSQFPPRVQGKQMLVDIRAVAAPDMSHEHDAITAVHAVFAAINGGEYQKAVEMGVRGFRPDCPEDLAEIRNAFSLDRAEVTQAHAGPAKAAVLATAVPVELGKAARPGHFGVSLVKIGERWAILDVDFLPDDKAVEKWLARFRSVEPAAIRITGIE